LNYKFSDLSINNITKFEHESLKFVPGINVIIGKNGTGKTHLLKILYTIAKSSSLANKDKLSFNERINNRIKGIFKIESNGKLIRNFEDKDFTINYKIFDEDKDFFIQYYAFDQKLVSGFDQNITSIPIEHTFNVTYFPTQEMITAYSEFIPFYEKYDVKYDETLYFLAKALSEPVTREQNEFQKKILAVIRDQLEGTLIKKGNTFYIKKETGEIEASMLAEGMKKLATLLYLIENGTITENSILIWDEPEIYFNPKLISVLTLILNHLAMSGIQIFMATHDYLLSHQLSLMDEYRSSYSEEIAEIRFFCLEESEKEGVKVHTGKNLTEIQNNPILEEFANHYDKERELFQRSMKDE